MAIIQLNPMLVAMRGAIGGIVLYNRYDRQCARRHVRPANPDTEAQRAVRRTFGDAVRSWQGLSGGEKDLWIRRSRKLSMSGYNLFISRFMRKNISRDESFAGSRNACSVTSSSVKKNDPSVSTPFFRMPSHNLPCFQVKAVSGTG